MKALLVAAALVLTAWANPEDVANAVAHEVMSPYCPGVTLHDCPSSSAQDMRRQIAGWAEGGMTKGEIIDRLEDEFGPSIRAVPETDGAGLFAWLLPGIAVIGGAVAAVALARRWTKRAPAAIAPAQPVSPEAGARLRAELDRLRSES
jgi:cytochrome c-type biogenesis protein CcmH/NrfF